MDQSDIVETAHALADAAREAILPWFRTKNMQAENKAGEPGYFDPVTRADRAAEEAMRAVLAKRRPDDAILGEEFGASSGRTGLTWVLDPIDGTRGFLTGTPTWGVLIALSDENGPLYGLIDQPYIGERFEGGLGRAEVTGPQGRRPLATLGNRPLSEANLFSTFPEVGTEIEGAAFRAVAEKVQIARYGMDCYAYALVASGQVDLVIEAGLNTYDIQAPMAIIEAAGGIVTDWRGGPAHHGGQVLAASGRMQHKAALDILSEFV